MHKSTLLICITRLSLTFLLPLALLAQNNNYNVFIMGNIAHVSNQMELEDMTAIGRISPANPQRFFVPDSLGNFTIALFIKQPGYFRLGRNILYLSPGDSLFIKTDFDHPEHAMFKGSHWQANDFLKHTPYPKNGSYCADSNLIKSTIAESIEAFVKYGGQREKLLLSLQDVTPQFIALEKARIKADIINSIAGLTWYFPERHRFAHEAIQAFQQNYMPQRGTLMAPFIKGFLNDKYLDLVVYQKITPYLLRYNQQDSAAAAYLNIVDWENASTIFQDMNSSNNTIDFDKIQQRIGAIQNDEYRDRLQAQLSAKMAFGNGNYAIDFTATTFSHQSVRLSSLHGKIILLDFWATWCGPCIKAFPQMELVKQHFMADTLVVIQSVSIDEKPDQWRAAVTKYKLGENSWLVNRYAIPEYQLHSIPRIIIIDKNFKIASYSGFDPTDTKGIIQFVENLAKQ